jgi:hypothetical protein
MEDIHDDGVAGHTAVISGLVLTRESLYEAVWRTPMRSLAIQHGCSDRGLAKTCKRHRIPVPPRGYWAKLAAGHRMQRPPLPRLTEAEQQELRNVDAPVPSPRRPEPGTVASQVAAGATVLEQRIRVRDDLRGAHPLVTKTRDLFATAWQDERGILHPDGGSTKPTGALAVHVSKVSIHRALRIADALINAVEERGWSVRCPAKSESRGTGVCLLGEEVAISIEEKVKRIEKPREERRVTKGHHYDAGYGPYTTILVDPHPRYGYEQLGQLALRVPWYGSPKLQIGDGVTRRLEDRLDEFLVGVVMVAEQYREWSREREERERKRLDEQRQREEVERRRTEEAARVALLERNVAAWRRAEDIRAYVAAARAANPDLIDEHVAYFLWALGLADELDPRRDPGKRPIS